MSKSDSQQFLEGLISLLIFFGVGYYVYNKFFGLPTLDKAIAVPVDQQAYNLTAGKIAEQYSQAVKDKNKVRQDDAANAAANLFESYKGKVVNNWVGKWQRGDEDQITLEFEHIEIHIICDSGIRADFIVEGLGAKEYRCTIPQADFANFVRSGQPDDIIYVSGLIWNEGSITKAGTARLPEIQIIPESVRKQ